MRSPTSRGRQRARRATIALVVAAKTRLGLIEVSTRSTRAVVLPDDDLATLFFERGDELVACGPIGVERGAPSVADAAADVVAWARGREAFVWRGLFAADPTLARRPARWLRGIV